VAGPAPGFVWNGLRVRIGIHYGPVEVVLDEVTKGYDYYGPTVNIAARVEGVTDGGQICMSEATAVAVLREHTAYTLSVLGAAELRGVKEPIQILCVCPTGLEARVFERRLAVGVVEHAGNDTDTFSSTSLNAHVPLDATTRPVRDTVRAALKALRGDDRVGVLEKLRKAWRVQLPNGRHFTGVSTSTTAPTPQRPSSQKRASMRSLSSMYSRTADTHRPPEEEDDEDIILRVVAQRLSCNKANPRSGQAIGVRSGGTSSCGSFRGFSVLGDDASGGNDQSTTGSVRTHIVPMSFGHSF
jgi:hypothetical protein